ncbi:hypothetical protein ACN47E_008253 [Coniothyrium glycines]
MPPGYGFLAKGIRYKTLHCRKSTREAGAQLYVVVDGTTQTGLRAPKDILRRVHAAADETLPARRAATAQRDAAVIAKARVELRRQFAMLPPKCEDVLLGHAFRKASGRVGRTGRISLEKKVWLAVAAHVRHKHSAYEGLLEKGCTRENARKRTHKVIMQTMKEWGLSAVSDERPRRAKKRTSARKTKVE